MKFLLGMAVGMIFSWWMFATACTAVVNLANQPQVLDLNKAVQSGGLRIDHVGSEPVQFIDTLNSNGWEVSN